MVESLSYDKWLKRRALILLVIFGAWLSAREGCPAQPPDTLNLQLQWSYPLSITDMRLVDLDGDGTKEILVGFNSDSARVGILDAVTQGMVWQSPGLHGSVNTVTAGDRNADGFLDIVGGGQRSDTSVGYVEVFDGPAFDSVHFCSGFDEIVMSAAISSSHPDSLAQILLGTYLYLYSSAKDGGASSSTTQRTGGLFVMNGLNFTIEDVTSRGTVRDILMYDLDGDGYEAFVLASDYYWSMSSPEPVDGFTSWSRIYSDYCGSLGMHFFSGQGPPVVVYSVALEACDFDDHSWASLIATDLYSDYNDPGGGRTKLACWNASTQESEWSMEWDFTWAAGNWVTDLAACCFDNQVTNAICAPHRNGLVELRSGLDGSLLAVSSLSHSIIRLEIGDVDHDKLAEICVAAGDSLYVYETLWVTTNVEDEYESHPNGFCLFQNYPNPFNPETIIRFTLPFSSEVTLSVHNILGQQVRTIVRHWQAGTHSVIWDGKNSSGQSVASGVYLYRLSAGQYQDTKKMLLIR
jgi:hypothetical protein